LPNATPFGARLFLRDGRPLFLPLPRIAIRLALRHHVRRGKSHGKEKHMSKNWNPNQGFPSPEQVARMVAAEVKHLAEIEYARNRGSEEQTGTVPPPAHRNLTPHTCYFAYRNM
jgi:hypothetical protein